jgi:eukaryotic-like serine/threonine-protein kinase
MTTTSRTCSKCERELAPSAPEGLCPSCLLGRALLSEVEEDFADGAYHLGDYELIEPIARGGMGVVYRARQRALNRVVALKLISGGELAAPDYIERFRIEAEAAASLSHPNIVPIYEIGEEDGRHFFSMRLIEGGSLGERLERGRRFKPEAAARLVALLARAVHYAHQRGILHRDIKPNNVLLNEEGEPLLTDFGLAKLIECDSRLTGTLNILGTPAYISPEQAAGNTGHLTTAIDVYGLGAVLYELLTGAPPFVGDTTMATVRLVLDKDPERPSRRNPAVDRDLETICLKCLEKEPARRYASAEALAEDLERWERGEPITARPITARERTRKWMRRHPAYATAVAVSVLALLTSVITSNFARVRVAAALEITQEQKLEIEEQQTELALRQRETVRQLARSLFLQGVQHAETGRNSSALAYWSAALRLETNHHATAARIFHALTQHQYAHPATPPLGHGHFAAQCEFSPDGSRFAVVSRDHQYQAWIRDAATGELLHRVALGTFGTLLDWSPDGKKLATAAGLWGHGPGAVQIWDAATGEPLIEPIILPNGSSNLKFSPDGQGLAVATVADRVRVFDANTGQARFPDENAPHITELADLVWSPDAKWIFGGGAREIRQVNPWTGKVLHQWTACDPFIMQICLSSDGRTYAVRNTTSTVHVGDAVEHRPKWRLEHGQPVLSITFDPAGSLLATAAEDGRVRLWEMTQGMLLATFDMGTPQRLVRFTPDGKRILSHGFDEAVHIWEVATARPLCEPLRHAARIYHAAVDPTGERLLTGSIDGTVLIWRLDTARADALRLPHESSVVLGTISPKGEKLATVTERWTGHVWDRRSGAPIGKVIKLEDQVGGIEFSADEKWLLVQMGRGAQVWDAETGTAVSGRMPNEGYVREARFSPEGDRVVTGGGWEVRIWNWRTGELLLPPLKQAHSVAGVRFSADGAQVLVTTLSRELQIWDATTGEELLPRMRQDNSPAFTRYTPDGRQIFCGAGYTLRFWDALTRQPTPLVLQSETGFLNAAVSSDNSRIITTASDNLVRIFSGHTGEMLTAPVPHGGGVRALAFAHDGQRFAIGGAGGYAGVFDTHTGRSLTGPLWHDDGRVAGSPVQVRHVEFLPDGRQLFTVGTDGSARLWDLGPATTEPIPEWLPRLAEAVGGLRLQQTAAAFHLLPTPYEQYVEVRQKLQSSADPGSWAQLARWFFAEASQRARSPLFQSEFSLTTTAQR